MNNTVPKSVFILLLALCGLYSHSAGAEVIYVHPDHLGNPAAYSNGRGELIAREFYTPYGERLMMPGGHDEPDFTGHVRDSSTGLVYMQARYYDPEIGRFLSVDPVTFAPDRLDHFNRYWYANGNPIGNVDPDGRESGAAFRSVNNATNGAPVEPPPQSPDDWAGPAIGVSLAVAIAPAAMIGLVELGAAALANPSTATALVNGAADVAAADALGGASLSGAVVLGSAASKLSKVSASKKIEGISDKFTKITEVRPGRGPGQTRAEYIRYKNTDGKVIRTRKDSYDRAGKYQHSKPMRGGPEGRPQDE